MKNLLIASFSLLLLAGCATTPAPELQTNATSSPLATATKQTLMGRPSVIVFGGTYCPHCQNAVPVFKTEIADPYAHQANIWVNVIDQKKFPVDVPQGFNPNFTFEGLAQKKCGYVPSWVVLDKETNPVLSSCGTEKSIDDMKEALNGLLSA